ncbi:MAG: hypothetical protein MAG715_00019 [Methanonatronarchaeales archaeon]|nr:hypothetical protein [Methanonatronarchaeales archaeon]
MITELSSLLDPGLKMYTDQGAYVGEVEDAVMNVDGGKLHGIALRNLNPEFADGERNVIVPFRWVRAIGDIVIIKHLPHRFGMEPAGEEEEEGTG